MLGNNITTGRMLVTNCNFFVSYIFNTFNLGIPLGNENGLVVGMVTATGIDLQNTNLAVKGSTVQNFLGKHGIHFDYDDDDKTLEKGDIFDLGKKFTVMVICYP